MLHPKIEDDDIMIAAHNHLDFTQDLSNEETIDAALQTVGLDLEQIRGVIAVTTMHRKAEVENFAIPRNELYAGAMLEGITLGVKIARAAAERAQRMAEELNESLDGRDPE